MKPINLTIEPHTEPWPQALLAAKKAGTTLTGRMKHCRKLYLGCAIPTPTRIEIRTADGRAVHVYYRSGATA